MNVHTKFGDPRLLPSCHVKTLVSTCDKSHWKAILLSYIVGRVALWLACSTHDPRVVGSNPIMGQVTLCPWARHLTHIV
jgi:hypothetical protein